METKCHLSDFLHSFEFIDLLMGSSPYMSEFFQRRLHAKYSPTKGLPDVLQRDFGFSTLPDKYERLNRLFNEMEKVLQITFGRDQRTTFTQLATNVEKNSSRKFTMNHLGQIIAVYPDAYLLKWEKPRSRKLAGLPEQWDLIVKQNVQGNKDIEPFFTMKSKDIEENSSPTKMPARQESNKNPPLSPVKLISPTKSHERDFILRSPTKKAKPIMLCPSTPDTRVKMDAKRMLWRKMIFRHLLVSKVREAHEAFLADNKLSHSDDQSVHPSFKKVIDKLVPDISSSLPQKPSGADMRDSDIRTFLQRINKTPSKCAERERTPERVAEQNESLVKSEPQTPINSKAKMKIEPQTPKTPLEQRLKAKFAARAALRDAKVGEIQKRRGMLYRLKDDILEVIRAHLNLNQCSTVGLGNRELLQKLGREINTPPLLLAHLKLLCEVTPKELCQVEPLNASSGPDEHFFRITAADAGPQWFPEAISHIQKEIDILDKKLEPMADALTLVKSPSSHF